MTGLARRLSAMLAALTVAATASLAGVEVRSSQPGRVTSAGVDLLATALLMGGTGQILSVGPSTPQFISTFVNLNYQKFISPTGLCTGGDHNGCALNAVYSPEQMWPLTGLADMSLAESIEAGRRNLDDCIRGLVCTVTLDPYTSTGVQVSTDSKLVVFGQSQSAAISTIEKRNLIAHPVAGAVNFVLVANPNRPNGGLLERFVGAYLPLIGIDFNGATPTYSPETNPLTTVDISRQYDGWSDFPAHPLNLLADLNALMGAEYLHSTYDQLQTPPLLQGKYQDTTYYLYPTELLPLLVPLSKVPLIGMPLAKALDAPLRVLVETGYERTVNPGAPTPAQWLHIPDPVTTLTNFAVAIPTGWDDAIAYVSGNPLNRPFHTAPQPVYGVGGPPVDAGSVDPYPTAAVRAGASTAHHTPAATASARGARAASAARTPRALDRKAAASRHSARS